MWERMKRFWRTVPGAPEVCFIAFDLMPATLLKCGPSDVQAMVDLFKSMVSFDEDENTLLHDAVASGSVDLLKMWCLRCIERRKGYLPLGILPMEMTTGSSLPEFVRMQRWVSGFKITCGDLTEAYIYLLGSIRQYILLPKWVPDIGDMWQVLTITLGPVPAYPYDPNEPMNIATKQGADHGVIIIVAAGNEGQLIKGNSLNPWSVPPWVIGVGATNEEGTQLLRTSSRGVRGQPYEAPTIVAPGETISPFGGLDHGHQMALEEIEKAPPGSVTTTVVGQNVYNYVKDKDGCIGVSHIKEGIASPVVPIEQVLKFLEQESYARLRTLHGTSLAAEYVNGICQRIVKAIKPLVPDLSKSEKPKLIKTILERMAQPIANLPPWEIGKGLVTKETAVCYLNSLTVSQLKQLRAEARNRW